MTFRLEGDAGDGIISLGNMFAKAVARSGGHVYTFRTYPAEVRGGAIHLSASRRPPKRCIRRAASLTCWCALNEKAFRKHQNDLDATMGVLLHPDVEDAWERAVMSTALSVTPSTLTRFAKQAAGRKKVKNVVVLGVLAELFGLDGEIARAVLAEQFQSKGADVVAANLKALDAGLTHARKHLNKADDHWLTFGERRGPARVVRE